MSVHIRTLLPGALLVLSLHVAFAQMDMAGPAMSPGDILIDTELRHDSSGTSIQPLSTPVPMLMGVSRGWTLMLHGTAFLADVQQQAANQRGGDKLFSTNWIMPMAQRRLGSRSTLTVRAMFSVEPATITGRMYPELFQQGETAYGRAIADGQHPHDFVMELAAMYDFRVSERTLLSLYLAPVGDPAIGPTAYPHRESASEDPMAALGHHQEDSTHIAFNVLTAGVTYRWLRIEGSGFHGAEPTESRWDFQPSPNGHVIDSDAVRLTLAPTPDVSAQYSITEITSPEALSPDANQRRQTASVMLNRSLGAGHDTTSMPGMDMATAATGNWSTTLLWGQTRDSKTGSFENSYLLESLVQLKRNSFYTRMEAAARTSELLVPTPSSTEVPIGHVAAFTLGYDRNFRLGTHLVAAPGVQATFYRTPDALVPDYGRAPYGFVGFIRFRIAGN
jgi:hypothetical protein